MQITKVIFMAKKFKTDIFAETYKISGENKSSSLGKYYFDFEAEPGKLNKLISAFDDNGIPLNSAYIDVEDKKLSYYPISIGQYGLAVFHQFLIDRSDESKAYFLKIADWFMCHYSEDNKTGIYWLSKVPKPEYKVFNPWKSAFAQSRAISILLRAWQLSGNGDYLTISKKALLPFTLDIQDEGVTAWRNAGNPFYEEYVASEPTMVLDGHIFSLFGLYDFVRAVSVNIDRENHELAKQLFELGIKSLKYWLPQYDMGYWMRFNLCKMEHYPKTDPCTISYLRLLRTQLDVLLDLTGEAVFQIYSWKLKKYDRLINILRMYPVKYRALKRLKRL
jgi:hypothetical protein